MLSGRDAAPASVVRSHVPGRHSGSLAGALRPRPGPAAVKGESPDAAVARRLTRRISRGASGPLITGRPKTNRAGLAKSRSRVISARHTPRVGTEKETGPPQART